MRQRDSHSGTYRWLTSPPSERRRDVGQDRFDHMGVVVDAELVGDGQQQRVGLGDRFVLLQLLDQDIGLGGVAAAEDRPGLSSMKPIWSSSSPPRPK